MREAFKPETIIIINSGIPLLKAYKLVGEGIIQRHIATLMHEHMIVAAIAEGITVDELEEILNDLYQKKEHKQCIKK